jgi:DNA-binding NarL/FixJ family response regulator
LSATSRVQDGVAEPPGEGIWSAIGKPFNDALKPLTDLFNNSTVGVAFCDKSFRCRAINHAFAEMIAGPSAKPIGKLLHKYFGKDEKKWKSAFQRAFATGSFLQNFELATHLRTDAQPRHWLVNLYPIKDDLGRVRLVAATFSEFTKGNSLEYHLGNFVARFQGDLAVNPNALEEEFSELLARSVQLASRSVALLKNSTSTTWPASNMRIEVGLIPLALFLTLNQADPSMSVPSQSLPNSQQDSSHDNGSSNAWHSSGDEPSPRELQVLLLLSQGQSSKQIGLTLAISKRTVETYRARIMRKLSLHSTAELVRYAIRNKIVEP